MSDLFGPIDIPDGWTEHGDEFIKYAPKLEAFMTVYCDADFGWSWLAQTIPENLPIDDSSGHDSAAAAMRAADEWAVTP